MTTANRPSSGSSSSLTPVLLVAVPLAVALVAGVIFASYSQGDAPSPEVVEATTSTWRALFWPFLLGTLAAVGIVIFRSQAVAEQDTRSMERLISHLDSADYDQAMRVARESLAASGHSVDKVGRVQSRLEGLDGAASRRRASFDSIGTMVTQLSKNLVGQGDALRDMGRAVDEVVTANHTLVQTLDGLSQGAEQGASSVMEMVAINGEVRDSIHNLALTVQESTSAIEEMTLSSKEVAKNIEELSTAAEETAASMNEMDVSISQVETNANETSKLSETVSQDAETGVAAIKQTIRGIDKIKESSRVGADVIGNLGQKISEIGNILNVIDDVAEQTNLLALNAAIIAAQAGEHGRGFAVVADEIKALAERTGSSTKEIAELVKTIQEQSRNAIEVMSKGVDDVEEGVRLGRNAEDALRKIVDSAKRSTLMIQAIAQATVEQSKGSKQVTNAISRIAETVQQIALATAEQAKGSEHIMQTAEQMRSITQQVERSADEQNRGGGRVTQAIEAMRELIDRASQAHRSRATSYDHLSSAMTQFKQVSDSAVDNCESLQRTLLDLNRAERTDRGGGRAA